MSTSWRLTTRLTDKTEITSTESEIIGATVIKSYKGSKNFVFFNKGDVDGVIRTFGYPSKEYPSIQDALDIVTKSSVWIASPYKNGLYGGVFVTPSGTISFVNGVSSKEIASYEEFPCEENAGIADGVVTSFETEFKYFSRIAKTSLKILVGDTDLEVTVDGDTGNITEENDVLDTDKTNSFAGGKLTLNFKIAPTQNISVQYTIDVSDSYFVLFDKNCQADDLMVKVTKSTEVDDAFEVALSMKDLTTGEYEELPSSPYVVGLTENSKDNMGTNIYIENIFGESQQYVTATVVNSVLESFTDDTVGVLFEGGDRGDEILGADIANTYSALQDTNKYQLMYAFDPTCSSEVITKFETLRNSYQKYCRFLYCTSNASASSIIATPATYSGGVTANRGMYCYCLTWGIHKDVYRGNDFLCSNMGLIAGRLVDVLDVGGGVPAWIDADGVGGILGSSITKLMQSATETELQQLDKLCFNPVIMDNAFGAMIVSWKTRQVKETVFSYIGQSSLADTILNLVEKNVLPYRIAKLIDQTAYQAVRSGIGSICRRYEQWLEDYYVLCDDTNNTGETKNAQKLMISLGIIFKGYASRIYFNVTVYKNGVNIEEELKKA